MALDAALACPAFPERAGALVQAAREKVYTDRVAPVRVERGKLLAVLRQHLQDGLLRMGAAWYRQARGIPQASAWRALPIMHITCPMEPVGWKIFCHLCNAAHSVREEGCIKCFTFLLCRPNNGELPLCAGVNHLHPAVQHIFGPLGADAPAAAPVMPTGSDQFQGVIDTWLDCPGAGCRSALSSRTVFDPTGFDYNIGMKIF